MSVRGMQITLLPSMVHTFALFTVNEEKGHSWQAVEETGSLMPAWSFIGIFYLASRAEWFDPLRKLELEVDSFYPLSSFSKTARTSSPVPLPWRRAQSTIIFLLLLLQVAIAAISEWVSRQSQDICLLLYLKENGSPGLSDGKETKLRCSVFSGSKVETCCQNHNKDKRRLISAEVVL